MEANEFPKRALRWIWAPLLTGILSAVTPTTPQLWTMVGGYTATNIEGVEKLPPNLVKAVNRFLEKLGQPEDVECAN